MKTSTWLLWIPTVPYVVITALLVSSPADRQSGLPFLVNSLVLVVGTILSHSMQAVRPAYVSGLAFLVQVGIAAVMIIEDMGDWDILLPVNAVICAVLALWTVRSARRPWLIGGSAAIIGGALSVCVGTTFIGWLVVGPGMPTVGQRVAVVGAAAVLALIGSLPGLIVGLIIARRDNTTAREPAELAQASDAAAALGTRSESHAPSA